jgi:hypothetical protein
MATSRMRATAIAMETLDHIENVCLWDALLCCRVVGNIDRAILKTLLQENETKPVLLHY